MSNQPAPKHILRRSYQEVTTTLSSALTSIPQESPLVSALKTHWEEFESMLLKGQRAIARAYGDSPEIAGAAVIGVSHLIDLVENHVKSNHKAPQK